MHMADALISPAVGASVWAATAATTVYCARKVRAQDDPQKVPLMGVTGAFVFAAQMINFTIPGTGSSGHLGGGLLLAVLLGPKAAFLVIASVLTVQALFMADGGLLALGCNIFNLGFFPAFVAYPVFRRIVSRGWARGRVFAGSILGAEIGLLLGALAVVLQTTLSGVSALPTPLFVGAMVPIHLAIGLVEGLATAVVVLFVKRAEPGLLLEEGDPEPRGSARLRPVVVAFVVATLVSGIALSWFASTAPDGLEWSIARVAGEGTLSETPTPLHEAARAVQSRISVLPDYGFRSNQGASSDDEMHSGWPSPDAGTSVAGLVGSLITLAVAAAIGLALSRRGRQRANGSGELRS